jgi:Tol biopolymer transport system component
LAGLAVVLSACAGPIAPGPSTTTLPSEATRPSPSASSSAPAPSPSSSSATPPADLPGGWLMFSRFDESTHTFLSTHVIHPDGTGERDLPLPGPEGGGRWSRDGTLIAVMTVLDDDRIGTAVIRADGTVERVLEIDDPTLNAVCTVWSPDDQRLACEAWDDGDPSRAGIYSVRASDGGDLVRLTTPPDGMADLPGDYSPDGSMLVFKRTIEEASGSLLVVDPTGEGEPRALNEESFENAGRFSPDGSSILTASGGQIKLLDLAGKVQETIVDEDGFAFGPVWSPDGQWIAYSRAAASPAADILVSRPDGSQRWPVTATFANEIVVEWGAAGDPQE